MNEHQYVVFEFDRFVNYFFDDPRLLVLELVCWHEIEEWEGTRSRFAGMKMCWRGTRIVSRAVVGALA
jgi:hypothetical protein